MHDEAATHYVDMIDQTTLGHRYIKQQFDVTPRIGWQIDPFGHSAVQAYLLGAEMGFDAFFFARADYQDLLQRRKDRTMEMIWQGSKSLGSSAEIFTGILWHHYEPPSGFTFDISSKNSPIQDDARLNDYNLPELVDLFVEYARNQSNEYQTNHLMWTMGDDFAYTYANTWFKQMDKLIHHVNLDGRVNVLYSTPSMYVDAVNAANETWPLKTGDFFPYADRPHCYWTGYFTSRSAFKGYVRKLSGFLQAARQLEFLVGKNQTGPNTDSLEEAMAIVQHHDGVSGTEKQHVANDYAQRLAVGSAEAEKVFNSALAALIGSATLAAEQHLGGRKNGSFEQRRVLHQKDISSSIPKDVTAGLKLEQCPLLNISYCPTSEAELPFGKSLVVVVYNPLGWSREEHIHFPVSSAVLLEVIDGAGNAVPSQLLPLPQSAYRLRKFYMDGDEASMTSNNYDNPPFHLVFSAVVPPLGYTTFRVRRASSANTSSPHISITSTVETQHSTPTVELTSSQLQLSFSSSTGLLTQLTNSKTGISTAVQQSYCWYNASNGLTEEDPYQASGAYLFRPNTSTCFRFTNADESSMTIVRGPLVEEVHQSFAPWLSQVIRIYKDSAYAEVQFTVGPIPIDDGLGKEVVTKLTTNLTSNNEFYTDSNGRDFLKRVRDQRTDWDLEVKEPIAGNYYPLNLGIYLKDNTTDFSVLVDRALGGSSIVDGEIELMLHRRLLYDDRRGVGEALNETVCNSNGECEGLTVQGSFSVYIGPSEQSAQWRRVHGQQVLMPLQFAFSVLEDGNEAAIRSPQFSAMQPFYELPPNVAIITLQEVYEDDDSKVLLRLANIFEVEESEILSKSATVDLQALFSNREIDEVVEVSLSANQKKSEMRKKLQWRIEGAAAAGDSSDKNTPHGDPMKKNTPGRDPMIKNSSCGDPMIRTKYTVVLAPMEIKTFLIEF
jgi:alpha-mannosidase